MKKRLVNLPLAALLLMSTLLFFTACDDDDEEEDTRSSQEIGKQTSEDESEAESQFEDLDQIAEKAIDSAEAGGRIKAPSADSTFPKILVDADSNLVTVDYGSTGSKFENQQRMRTGKILISYQGGYDEPGSERVTTTENYKIEAIQVMGTRKVDVHTRDSSTVTVYGDQPGQMATLIDGQGREFKWKTEKTRLRIDTNNTALNPFDDAFHFYGKSSGTNRFGQDFTSTVSPDDPLKYTVTCWLNGVLIPISGTSAIDMANGNTHTLNYGSGECDYKFTINGVEIDLQN